MQKTWYGFAMQFVSSLPKESFFSHLKKQDQILSAYSLWYFSSWKKIVIITSSFYIWSQMSHHSWFGSLLMVGNCFRMRLGEKQAVVSCENVKSWLWRKKSIFSEVFFTLHKFVQRQGSLFLVYRGETFLEKTPYFQRIYKKN